TARQIAVAYTKYQNAIGPTVFGALRHLSKNLEPSYFEKNEINSDLFSMPAEKGRMLIWPSYIPHAVEQGAADENEDRIVVAFNIMIRGLIDLSTARLELR